MIEFDSVNFTVLSLNLKKMADGTSVKSKHTMDSGILSEPLSDKVISSEVDDTSDKVDDTSDNDSIFTYCDDMCYDSDDETETIESHTPLMEAMKYLKTENRYKLYQLFAKRLLEKMAKKDAKFPNIPIWYTMKRVYNREGNRIEFTPHLTEKRAENSKGEYEPWEGKWGEEVLWRISKPNDTEKTEGRFDGLTL